MENETNNAEEIAEKAIKARLDRQDRQLDALLEALAKDRGLDADALRAETERVAAGKDDNDAATEEHANKIEVVKSETRELKESWQTRYSNMVMKEKLRDAFETAGGAPKAWKSAQSVIGNIDDGMAFSIDEHENLVVINKYSGDKIAADNGDPLDPARRIRNMLKDNDYLVRVDFDKRRLLIDSPDYWKMRREELKKTAKTTGYNSSEYIEQRQEMIDEINSMDNPEQKKTGDETSLEISRRMKDEGKGGLEIAKATGLYAPDDNNG